MTTGLGWGESQRTAALRRFVSATSDGSGLAIMHLLVTSNRPSSNVPTPNQNTSAKGNAIRRPAARPRHRDLLRSAGSRPSGHAPPPPTRSARSRAEPDTPQCAGQDNSPATRQPAEHPARQLDKRPAGRRPEPDTQPGKSHVGQLGSAPAAPPTRKLAAIGQCGRDCKCPELPEVHGIRLIYHFFYDVCCTVMLYV